MLPALHDILAGIDARLAADAEAALDALDAAVRACSRLEAEQCLANALALAEAGQKLAAFRALLPPIDNTPLYLVSSLFLAESFRFLVKDPAEDMHFVTGSELGRVRVLERMVDFDKTVRTAAGVTGDPASTHRALIGLAAQGHRLTAWFHSHPGTGAEMTHPSSTDLAHQRQLEQGRYPVVGAIFSRDGFVRFFSANTKFRVQLFGSQGRRVEEHVYQLDLA